jgi:hypothetical protein
MLTSISIKTGAAVLVACGLLLATPASATEKFDPAALPHDKATLEKLNDSQLIMLRQAVRLCDDMDRSRHSGNICVIRETDKQVRASDSPSLKAFHWSLTATTRYDDKRTMVDVARILK